MAGNYDMSFDDYLAYTDAQTDDMPLYLFDCKFAEKGPQLAADYKVAGPCEVISYTSGDTCTT